MQKIEHGDEFRRKLGELHFELALTAWMLILAGKLVIASTICYAVVAMAASIARIDIEALGPSTVSLVMFGGAGIALFLLVGSWIANEFAAQIAGKMNAPERSVPDP